MRSAVAKQHGLDEALVGELANSTESGVLTEAHKAALDLADQLMTQPGQLPDEVAERVRLHFTRSQIIELTLDIMKWNYQKVSVVLGTDVEIVPGELSDLVFDAQGHWVRGSK